MTEETVGDVRPNDRDPDSGDGAVPDGECEKKTLVVDRDGLDTLVDIGKMAFYWTWTFVGIFSIVALFFFLDRLAASF